jgi:hypothetical protein
MSDGWNGMTSGKAAKDGIYFWTLEYTTLNGDRLRESGSLNLFGQE